MTFLMYVLVCLVVAFNIRPQYYIHFKTQFKLSLTCIIRIMSLSNTLSQNDLCSVGITHLYNQSVQVPVSQVDALQIGSQ